MQSLIRSILAEITAHGLNSWEADLCKISILSDSITILTKSIKSDDSSETKELLISVLDKITVKMSKRLRMWFFVSSWFLIRKNILFTVICRDKKSHSTLKLITLNGLGALTMPDKCENYGSRSLSEIVTSLIDLFIEMLSTSEVDDLILSETMKSAQRLLLNAPEKFELSKEGQEKVSLWAQSAI